MIGFIREAWPIIFPGAKFVEGWHIRFICEHLEAITSGKLLALGWDNRLLANVPPSSMKSLIVSVFWPAWEWGPGGKPWMQYIATSFKEDFCYRDAVRMRTLVMSDWYQSRWPNTRLVKTSEGLITNVSGGKREAIAFGSLTGGKCDRLIIDDPHSVDQAESDADRERAVLRFRESVTMRLNDPEKSAIIVIMQRLHERDISGVITDQLKLRYVWIMLPMRFEPERKCVTPLGEDPRTIDGELLFPERFPKEVVDRDEKAMGSHATASQFQQRPTPRGGLLFKVAGFKFVKAAPTESKRVRGWDLAASEDDRAAYTCGVKVAFSLKERKFFVEHVTREHVSNPEQMMVQQAQLDGKECEISFPQDPGAAGKIQAASIAAALVGFKAYFSPESGDKYTRALPVAAQLEAGNICLVEGEWNQAFIDELAKFPSGAFKDQVDALSRAFGRFVLSPIRSSVHGLIVTQPKNLGENFSNVGY